MSEIAALAVVRVAEIKNYSGKIITLLLLFAKLDALWKTYRRHYGKPGSTLPDDRSITAGGHPTRLPCVEIRLVPPTSSPSIK
jgi:hypothetical protein